MKFELYFIILAYNLYINYELYLKENNEIDFDDMLKIAKKVVENSNFFYSYKYIIIDEFQDTSCARFNLIYSLTQRQNCNLFVVGDDFQSIYRFSGCDMGLFLNLKRYYPDLKILKLQRTYRNSQELISVAGKFIMKNKNQIPKKLISEKHNKKPINLIYTNNIKKCFLSLLKILKDYEDILVLGRNNFDINFCLDIFVKKDDLFYYKYDKNIFFKYLTIHKSKGLESNNVIILNCNDDMYGIPSKKGNAKVLNYISIETQLKYDEERRLFYVALTRTKNNIYILLSKKNESIFIKELKKDYYEYLNIQRNS